MKRSFHVGFYFPTAPSLHLTPQTLQLILTILFATVCVAFLLFAIHRARVGGSLLGLALLIGGLIASINEAPIDALTLCWYPRGNLIKAYNTIAPIPLWVALAYMAFMGGVAYVLLLRARKGVTNTQLWAYFGVFILSDFVVELPVVNLHDYAYYGGQPLDVAHVPLYWPFLNGPGIYVTVALLLRAPQAFRGWRVLLAAALPAMTYAAGSAASGWPVFTVLHMKSRPELINQAAGLLSVGLGLLVLSIVIPMIANGAPAPVADNPHHDAGARIKPRPAALEASRSAF
jgi:hypothetical protein